MLDAFKLLRELSAAIEIEQGNIALVWDREQKGFLIAIPAKAIIELEARDFSISATELAGEISELVNTTE